MRANIEFASISEGSVLVIEKDKVSYLREKENRELIDELYERIEREFPEAFKALCDFYEKSKKNFIYYKFKVVRKFIRCNFGNMDLTSYDIDDEKNLHFEKVVCPCRGECPLENIVCSPIFASGLSRREEEIIKVAMNGGTAESIAKAMCISVYTVRSHMNGIIAKLNFHSFKEVIKWWHDNNNRNDNNSERSK